MEPTMKTKIMQKLISVLNYSNSGIRLLKLFWNSSGAITSSDTSFRNKIVMSKKLNSASLTRRTHLRYCRLQIFFI